MAVIGVLASIGVASYDRPRRDGVEEAAKHAVQAALQAASDFYVERRVAPGSYHPAASDDWGYTLLTVKDLKDRAPALSGAPAAPNQLPGSDANPDDIYLRVLSRWEVVVCSASEARAVFCAKESRLSSNDAAQGTRTYAKSADPSQTVEQVASSGSFGPSW